MSGYKIVFFFFVSNVAVIGRILRMYRAFPVLVFDYTRKHFLRENANVARAEARASLAVAANSALRFLFRDRMLRRNSLWVVPAAGVKFSRRFMIKVGQQWTSVGRTK